ncbi:hypothetical protein HGRIS_011427 [Hohenbuehelia grisea]|uniref:Fungal N-terminal domain-containing protein n=1 Tax=Hohenbuehelia grisea TaxID=104357 RepID=A0ABR3JW49_9AGAR
MDPISITAFAIGLVDIASKVKDSIDKVAQNHTRLSQLADDVLRGMTDIKDFCDAHDKTQALAGATELRGALNAVATELNRAYKRCKIPELRATRTPFAKVLSKLSAWLNRAEIEADISRLREEVQTCHLRFISFSSARNERNILLVLHDQRVMMRQVDRLFQQMLLENRPTEMNPPPAASFASLQLFDYLDGGPPETSGEATILCTLFPAAIEPDSYTIWGVPAKSKF